MKEFDSKYLKNMQRDKCVFISKQTEEIVIINFVTKF